MAAVPHSTPALVTALLAILTLAQMVGTDDARAAPSGERSGAVEEPGQGLRMGPRLERVDRAVDLYLAGEYLRAERLLGLAADDPVLPDEIRALVLFNRGAARLQLNRFRDAIADFDAAERLDFPQPAQLHLARGLAWEFLDRDDMAANDFVDALRADPDDPSVRAKVRTFFDKP